MSDYDYDDDEYTGEDEDNEPERWRMLSPKERLQLMKNIFTNEEWYDGTPFSEGGMPMPDGSHNPDFSAITDRTGAPKKEAIRYYKAWLGKQGLDPKSAMNYSQENSSGMTSVPPVGQTTNIGSSQSMPSMSNMSMTPPTPQLPQIPMPQGNGEDSGMWAMMGFLTQQQWMQMQQQQFQMEMMMRQRQFDQQRESDMRREQMARDQQFMQQQTTLLRESFKKANDSGFGGKLVEAAQEKMIEDMLGGRDDSWKDSIKDVLGSDTLKEAVAGLGGALSARKSQIPAGYDDTRYNPYAQPLPQQVQQIHHAQPMQQPLPTRQQPMQQYSDYEDDEPLDGVFFDDQPTHSQVAPQDMTRDEYSKILFHSFSEMLGPQMQDPQVSRAVQEQIEVAVDITLLEMPEAIPQIKLQSMGEKMLLVRNLRDICFGLRDLRSRVSPGEEPNGLILAAVITELRKRPEFYKIFSDNSYEEIIAQLEPFKDTGAIKFDYEFLIRPEIADIAVKLLSAVAADKLQKGIPQ